MVSKEDIVKYALCDALEELLKTKDLQNISVQDLIDKSGLSRSTFYRCFNDKYELAFWKVTKLLDRLMQHTFQIPIDESLHSSDKSIIEVVYHIECNKSMFRKLLKYKGQNSFEQYYEEKSLEYARQNAEKRGKTLSNKDCYTILYHAAGLSKVIENWLINDDNLSYIEISKIINNNRNDLIREVY